MRKRKKYRNPMAKALEAVDVWEFAEDEDITDILGSYTGKPKKLRDDEADYHFDTPDQDADDL